jgi:hypothetical protein
MFLRVDQNPNCEAVEGRVFTERTLPQDVAAVLRLRDGKEIWCDIIAWGDDGEAGPAQARKVDDSGEGSCYLIYGGDCGLRLRALNDRRSWSLGEPDQWGEPFLLLPPEGQEIRFL